jgi:uncharacterized membrane protein YgdD (TMEM256/DUF423 family)
MRQGDGLSALAALACAAAVALAAYASHGASAEAAPRLGLAAAMAFGHGLAVILLSERHSLLSRLARLAMLVGIAAFSGGLALAAIQGGRAPSAPFGGGLLILAWLLLAFDLARQGGGRR